MSNNLFRDWLMANQMLRKAILTTSIAAALVVLIFMATWAFVNQLG
jgi:predicted secreted protein